MATVNKDFRVKNGLVVEGSTATVNGSSVLTEASTEFLQDTTADMLTNGSHTNISFSYNDLNGTIDATVSSTPTFEDKIIFEGVTVDSYETVLQVVDPTSDNTITLPDATTTLVGDNTTQTLTNKTINVDNLTGNNLQIQGNDITSYSGSGETVILQENATLTNPYINTGINFNGSLSGQTILQGNTVASGTLTLPATTGTIAVQADIPTSTDGLSEGTLNQYFTDERAQDAVGNAVDGGLEYNDATGAISVTVNNGIHIDNTDAVAIDRTVVDPWYDAAGTAATEAGYVQDNLDLHKDATSAHGVNGDIVGTTDTQTLTNKTIGDTLKFNTGSNDSTIYSYGNDLTVYASANLYLNTDSGDIVLQPDNKAYIGSASAGNEIATNSYVDNAVSGLDWKQSVNVLSIANVPLSGLVPLTIDGHTVSDGYRVLLTAQTTNSQNGIYDVSITGGSYLLSRTQDADAYGELVGAAVFVMEGDTYNNTSWVQSNHYLTDFTLQDWVQFSGSGTMVAGEGITIDGLEVSVDRTTVDTWYEPAGAIETHSDTTFGVHGVNGDVVGTTDIQTLSNKTLTNPEISTILNGAATLTLPTSTGTLALTSDIPVLDTDDVSEGTNNLYFTTERTEDAVGNLITSSSHNGISVVYTDNGANAGTLEFNNDGVLSITGTTDQVSADVSTGNVTLSLPQNIATTSSPTFYAVTVESVTLGESLIGSATESLTTSNPTVVDSWSTSLYSSAKYIVQMKKNNDIEVIEVLVTVDGNNNVYLTEYADVISNVQLGTTDAEYSSGNVNLLVSASNGTTVKVHKTLIEA